MTAPRSQNFAQALSQKLADLVGESCLLPENLFNEYAVDGLIPQAVVQPTSRETICRVMSWASSEKLAVAPRGGGTQLSLGNIPSRLDLVVDLSRCNRLLDYQPADLTATVEAGITLAALQRELAAGGKSLSLEAPLPTRATIGGILAANSSGPLRHSYGPVRDWLIGISVVGADGTETKAGGKVVKNVTGYDLNKLYSGSLGTLGIIVEATFKLAPLAADSGALVAAFSSVDQAVAGARDLLTQVYAPQGIQVVDALTARRLELTASIPDGGAVVIAFCCGRPRAVQRRLEEGASLLGKHTTSGVERLDSAAGDSLLNLLTDFGWSADTTPLLGVKLNVPPSATGLVLSRYLQNGLSPTPGFIADPGFGSIKLLWWEASAPAESTMTETIAKLRNIAAESGGTLIVEQCPLAVKAQIDVWGGPNPELDVMRRIKQNLDPDGVLNPGRFMGRL